MNTKNRISSLRWLALSAALVLFGSGCAVLHHVQVGDVDDRGNDAMVPFQIMVSETGVNVKEIGAMAKATNTNAGKNAAGAAEIIALLQMGPRTGNPVYDQRYAERVIYLIHEKCPTGRVTGLMSVREERKYPAISGEIVKINGYCRKPRAQAKEKPQESTTEVAHGEI